MRKSALAIFVLYFCFAASTVPAAISAKVEYCGLPMRIALSKMIENERQSRAGRARLEKLEAKRRHCMADGDSLREIAGCVRDYEAAIRRRFPVPELKRTENERLPPGGRGSNPLFRHLNSATAKTPLGQAFIQSKRTALERCVMAQ